MDVERVRILKTVKSRLDGVFRKGYILNAPFPPAILREIEKGTGTVEVIGKSITPPSSVSGAADLAKEREAFEKERLAFEEEKEEFYAKVKLFDENKEEGFFDDLEGRVGGEMCPHCERGPFKNLGSHIAHAHKDIEK